jgi:hypothetical protein
MTEVTLGAWCDDGGALYLALALLREVLVTYCQLELLSKVEKDDISIASTWTRMQVKCYPSEMCNLNGRYGRLKIEM